MKSNMYSENRVLSQDERLAEILGRLSDELQQNPQLSDDEVLTRYPDHAERLCGFLSMLRSIAALPKTEASLLGSSRLELPDHESHTLGDFRILHELGRGGMGTVYEAEQISLGRRVAIKTLPFAALAHEKALQRFRNEVRAAAALQHPHIVPVYSVGEERGIHFYSMQLIHGQSLAELIHQTRCELLDSQAKSSTAGASRESLCNEDPTIESSIVPLDSTTVEEQALISTVLNPVCGTQRYRKAAQIGLQAAEALQYAHDQGVLHRDIKPGNLMLDASGKLYITDFGLARIETDAGLTMTGDILGTLRYMAPEQALAKRVVIDHRADIYSLGATLYELLTLQPAFGETDRSELLKQIAFEEPQSLRKVDRSIPTELETIVLKAMAKDPEDRYQSAQELADDLRFHLHDQPIKAKPPSSLQRMAKWSRRHMGVVWTALASLLAITAASTVATMQISHYYEDARIQRDLAEEAANTADREAHNAKVALSAEAAARQRSDMNLYQAHIREAQGALQSGNVSRAEGLLFKYLPTSSETDHRGWEWRYLLGQLDAGSEIVDVHPSRVRSVCLSPEGHLFATLSSSHVRLWNLNPRKIVRELHIPHGMLTGASFSPDGQSLAITSMDGILRLWAVGEQGALRTIRPTELTRSNTLNKPSWSPDGESIASTFNGGVVIWDVSQGIEQKRIRWAPSWGTRMGDHASVESVAWHPSGKLIAIGTHSESHLLMVDVETEEVKVKARPHNYDLFSIQWTKDGERVVTGSFDQHAKILNGNTGEMIHDLLHPSHVIEVELSPDESRLACATTGQDICIWSTETGSLDSMLSGHRDRVATVAWGPDGRLLLSGGADNVARIWNMEKSESPARVSADYEAFHLDSGLSARKIDADNLEVYNHYRKEIRFTTLGDRACWSPSGRTIAVQGGHTIRVIDAETGLEQTSFTVPEGHRLLRQWSGDGTALLTRKGTELRIWSAERGVEEAKIDAPNFVSATWSPENRLLALLVDRDVEVWDTVQSIRLARFRDEQLHSGFQNVDWSPDGKQIATSGWAGRIRLWESSSGRLLHDLVGHTPNHYIRTVAWSSNSSLLASGGWDNSIKIWDTLNGREIYTLYGHNTSIRSVVFAPDSKRLCSSDYSGMVKLWDLDVGEGMLTLENQDGVPAKNLHWTSDGQTIWYINEKLPKCFDARHGYQMKGTGELAAMIARHASSDTLRLALSGRMQESDDALELAEGLVGVLPPLRYQRSLILLNHSKIRKAEQDLEIACRHEGSPEAFAQLAWLLASRKDDLLRTPGEAENIAQQLVTDWPQVEEFWTLLGLAQYREAKYAESLETLDCAIELGLHGTSIANLIKAMAQMRLGNEIEARNSLKMALEIWDDQQYFSSISNCPTLSDANQLRNEAEDLIGSSRN